jgi:hypothetical protein
LVRPPQACPAVELGFKLGNGGRRGSRQILGLIFVRTSPVSRCLFGFWQKKIVLLGAICFIVWFLAKSKIIKIQGAQL